MCIRDSKKEIERGGVVLNIEDLWVKDKRGVDALKGLNLKLHAGEILGIAGVDGNGQTELIDAITGMTKANRGIVNLNGVDISKASPRKILDTGMNSIPEDRQKRGLILDYPIKDNLILERVRKEPFSTKGRLNFKKIDENARNLVEKFDIRPADINEKAVSLSGGNQQKVIIAREIANNPDVLIAAQPTRGLDVGAIEFIHQYLVELRNQNKAVLLISFELDEIMDLSLIHISEPTRPY